MVHLFCGVLSWFVFSHMSVDVLYALQQLKCDHHQQYACMWDVCVCVCVHKITLLLCVCANFKVTDQTTTVHVECMLVEILIVLVCITIILL